MSESVRPTRQQLAVVQCASQGSYTGTMVGYVPLLQSSGHLTVTLHPEIHFTMII